MRTWLLDDTDEQVDKLTCSNCQGTFWVEKGAWPGQRDKYADGSRFSGRPCPFCFKTSSIPGTAIVYDSTETLRVSDLQVHDLMVIGLVKYSPKDGPNGRVYRPEPGVTMDRIRRAVGI